MQCTMHIYLYNSRFNLFFKVQPQKCQSGVSDRVIAAISSIKVQTSLIDNINATFQIDRHFESGHSVFFFFSITPITQPILKHFVDLTRISPVIKPNALSLITGLILVRGTMISWRNEITFDFIASWYHRTFERYQ